MKDHILMRLLDHDDPDEIFSDEACENIIFYKDRIYSHKTLRINYVTYDGIPAQDCISPKRSADVMVYAREEQTEENPNPSAYWYARVVGIFHANVIWNNGQSHFHEPQKVDFLFVRWLGTDPDYEASWKVRV